MPNDDYRTLADQLAGRGVDVDAVKAALKAQRIETPSWGYGDSGTRFKVFAWPGAARDVHEKLADAAFVHRLTGITPSVALHIPWDMVDDWPALKQYAAGQGVQIGAINPNVFQDDAYKFGSAYHASDYPVRVAEERGSGAGSGGFRFRADPKVLRDP